MTAAGHPRAIGKYEIVASLGAGGMGVVYKARDPLIDRTVAIKTILADAEDDSLSARLRIEAKSAGRLTHPNIVTIYDFGQADDVYFLAMEYVEGANLRRVIQQRPAIPLLRKVDMIVRLCEALGYAHEMGVIHRDISPANICLTERGEPKILDFGLARFDETRLTRTGKVSGTLGYMAPERLQGESGPSVDLFALAAVAYELFTYAPAFPGSKFTEVVTRIMSEAFPVPASRVEPSIPVELDAILAKAMAKDPKNRYRNAAEFARALNDFRLSDAAQAANVPASICDVDPLKTLAIRFAGSNPYSAGDLVKTRDHEPSVSADDVTEQFARKPQAAPEATELMSVLTADAATPRTVTAPQLTVTRSEVIPRTVVAPAVVRPTAAPAAVAAEAVADRPVQSAVVREAWKIVAPLAAMAGTLGMVPFARDEQIALVTLVGIATVLWFGVVKNAASLKLPFLLAAVVLLRLPLFIQATVGAAQSNAADAPYAELLALVVGGAGAWGLRALLLVSDVVATWLLWDSKKPHRAVAYGAFPLLIVEGAWLGNVYVLAGTLLVAAYVAMRQRKDATSAFAAAVAAGLAPVAAALLVPLYAMAWRMFYFLGAVAAAVLLPIIARGSLSWTDPLVRFAAGSPLLTSAVGLLERLAASVNAAGGVNQFLRALATRLGRGETLGVVTDASVALVALGVLFVVALLIIGERSRSPEHALVNSIGFALLAGMVQTPGAWLLLVPFALVAETRLWMLFALFSAALYLQPGSAPPDWIVYGTSLALPVAAYLAIRLQQLAGEKLSPLLAEE